IPEIEASTIIYTRYPDVQFAIGDKTFDETGFFIVDSTFFNIFSFEFLYGDPKTALSNPNSLVITESLAKRLFGNEEALGKIVSLRNFRIESVMITGVIENVPRNSHFTFESVISSSTIPYNNNGNPAFLAQDYFFDSFCYLLLRNDANIPEIEDKIMGVVESRWGEMLRSRGVTRQYPLMSLNDIYLRSTLESEIGVNGNINYIYLFSAIAVFVLLIASFNFINLSTAQSAKRAKEVGLRKVFGAYRNQLINQFLGESVIQSVIGLVFGITLAVIFLPVFNNLAGKEYLLSSLVSVPIISGLLLVIVYTGLISGSFPAFVLSSFEPIAVIRSKILSGSGRSMFRRILVVFQFALSVFMIVVVLAILKQIDFLKNKDLGFNRDQMVVVEQTGTNSDALRQLMVQDPDVVSVSFDWNVPGTHSGDDTYIPEGKTNDESIRVSSFGVGYDFIKNYEIDLIWGRDFSREFGTDATEAVIINETAANQIGWGEDALGKEMIEVSNNNRRRVVIGVIRDYHHKSLKLEITPTVLELVPNNFRYITLKIRSNDVAGTLEKLEAGVKELYPDNDYSYYFIDDSFRNLYEAEERVRQIYTYFGILAIFIACLGLYALASFTVERRTKEIGIRKVLGASAPNVTYLLSREFIIWVLAANVIAWPSAWYIVKGWLKTFAYQTSLGIDIFIYSGIISLVIAALTISIQTVKASFSNPIDSIRYE
ncbi:FtsX-like permease family protein, partial [candidate division KSB1 bacterium]